MKSVLPLLLVCWGCAASAVPIGTVRSAPDFPAAERFAMTGVSVPSIRGEAEAEGGDVWVIPVVDPDAEVSDPVYLWVAPPFPQPDGVSPEIWLSRISDGFDRRARTLEVVGQAGDSSPYSRAIADAESRFSVSSHPLAPVLIYPPR